MTQTAVPYQEELVNQGAIGLSQSTEAISAKAQEAQTVFLDLRQLIVPTGIASFWFSGEHSLPAFLRGKFSTLTLIEWLVRTQFTPTVSIRAHGEVFTAESVVLVSQSPKDEISPDAEEYARSLGIYGSLLRSQELARCAIPEIRALRIERYDDPEEGGHSVIRFEIVTSKTVEEVLQLDDELQDLFCREIPPRHQPYFAITYHFEK